jgi:integrase
MPKKQPASPVLPVLPLMTQFIQESKNGKRLQANGKRISAGTIRNYEATYKLLESFSLARNFPLGFRPIKRISTSQLKREQVYWKRFYTRFCTYLYDDLGYFDNYVGLCIKNLKVFFAYLEREKGLLLGSVHKQFYVPREAISIYPLLPEELHGLIYNTTLEQSLSLRLQETKDFFVFGCTVALRVSDLIALTRTNLRLVNGQFYLSVRARKTGVDTLLKLPDYAVAIIEKYKRRGKWLLPRFNSSNLNQYIKKLLAQAGFTHPVRQTRTKRGKEVIIRPGNGAKVKELRFCDVSSTHSMRRTAITTLLSLGMTEQLVRKIAGYSAGSKEFYRYVLWSQAYQDKEAQNVYSILSGLGSKKLANS